MSPLPWYRAHSLHDPNPVPIREPDDDDAPGNEDDEDDDWEDDDDDA